MKPSVARVDRFLVPAIVVLLFVNPAWDATAQHLSDAVSSESIHRTSATVSPVPDWSVEAATFLGLGISVDTAGDVNGDGYDDIIVGTPHYERSTVGGAARVYHGSLSGPSTSPDWMGTGSHPYGDFGSSVATAGDVNGDGYDDVLVGDPYDAPGRVDLFLGSAFGLSSVAAWSGVGPSNPPSIRFGLSIGTAEI